MESCQETSGFLFHHRCGRPAVFSCAECHKPICPQHARLRPPEAHLCVGCAARAAGGDDWGRDDDEGDDPYFYSARYRRRAGRADDDPMDFTEGDQGKLDDGGEAFEGDMGGS